MKSRTFHPFFKLGPPSVLLAALACTPALAQSSHNGLTGYLNMPSAFMQNDGDLRVGFSYAFPYPTLYVSLQAMPWLEVSGRYTQFNGLPPSFRGQAGENFGSAKDKAVAAKLRLLEEGAFGQPLLPQLAFGVDDKGFGTGAFSNYYFVASKRAQLGEIQAEASVGFGRERIDGPFGGLRLKLASLPNWAFVAEYDRTNFARDTGAAITGVASRKIGRINAGVEYTAGPFSLQLGSRDGGPSLNAHFTVPFGQRVLIPKVNEPEPYVGVKPRPDEATWNSDKTYWQGIVTLLHQDGYRNVRVSYKSQVLKISLASTRHLEVSRAVGRAARVVLAHAPLETAKIEVAFTINDVGLATYSFTDVPLLQRFYNGLANKSTLRSSIDLRYATADEARPKGDIDAALDEFSKTLVAVQPLSFNLQSNLLSSSYATHRGDLFYIGPIFSAVLNDPSGAFKYDLGIEATAKYRLGQGLFIEGGLGLRLSETVTDVVQPSNSLLPRVRTDIAEYARGARLKVNKLVVNKYWQPATHFYARASAGIYEEMFAGFGAQLMYAPPGGRWSTDLTLDYVAQRDFKNPFKFRDYRILTGHLATHVSLPDDITATVRSGRFLAGDSGVRFEVKRQFASGVQIGVWYTRTNGQDITSPGTPASPYRDKGVFMSIPLETLMTRHTASVARLSLSPWTRDVGAMVQSPGDLRLMLERSLIRNVHELGGMRNFGETPQEVLE